MPEYELIYFENIRGKAEHIKYILKQAGVSYKETNIKREDWPTIKPTALFGQCPMFMVDGKQLCQSVAIARYLANEHGLNGETAWDKVLCDMYVDGVQSDLYNAYQPCYLPYFKGGGRTEAMSKFAEFRSGALKEHLARYEKFLVANGTGYLVGNKVTWADLVLAEMLDRFMVCFEAKDVLNDYPHLARLVATVHDLPAMFMLQVTWADLVLAEMLDRFMVCFEAKDVLNDYPHLARLVATVHDLPAIKAHVETRPTGVVA